MRRSGGLVVASDRVESVTPFLTEFHALLGSLVGLLGGAHMRTWPTRPTPVGKVDTSLANALLLKKAPSRAYCYC